MLQSRLFRGALPVVASALVLSWPGAALADISGSVTTPATFQAQSAAVKRISTASRMTKDPAPARAFTGPTSMAVDPQNPRIIVAATAELRTRICYLTRSEDGGKTWKILPAVPALGTYQYCTSGQAGTAQASLAFGRNHVLYYALEGYGSTAGTSGMGSGKEPVSILLARSTNLGKTWNTTFVDSNRGKTGTAAPSDGGVTGLAVDTSGPQDIVYVGFQQSFPNAATGTPLTNGTMAVSVSKDGGRTFGTPINLNNFNNVQTTINGVNYPLIMKDGFGSPFMTVHDGVVLAVAGSSTPAGVTVPGPSGVFNPLPQLIARSTNQGKTWTVQELSPPIYTPTGSQTGLGWSPLGGPHGEFVAAYAATPSTASSSGSGNIVFQRSTDGGQTWSSPVVLNDDNPASLQFTSFYPQLGVAPNGRIDVIFEDNRNLNDYQFSVYYTYSTDGGLTWAHNVQLSDQPINFGYGISYNSDIRQPPGVASANQYAYAGWADTRNANPTTQNQDDYGAMAQFSSLPAAGNTALDVLAAIFGGLAAGGLALLILTRSRSGRRTTGIPQVGAQPEVVTAE